MAARDYGQYGGVTRAVELVGERWALLIVRDLLVGPRRYGELAAGLPRIPTNILAARLKELQAAGIIRRAPRSRIIIYELTPYGRELEPVVLALSAWGFKALDEPRDEQVVTPDALTIALRSTFLADAAAHLPPTTYAAQFDTVDLRVRVAGRSLDIAPGTADEADLAFRAGPGIRRLIAGDIAPEAAVVSREIEVRHGRPELLDRFSRTFHVAA